VTTSTGLPRPPAEVAPIIVEALGGLPVEVLMTVGDADLSLGSLPANRRVQPFLNYGAILPRTSVAIVHGGIGTAMRCLDAGVPMVVVPPEDFEQRANAAEMQRQGCAVVVLEPTVARIADAVTSMLRPDCAERRVAREIATELRSLSAQDPLRAVHALVA
jgi:UDP:flavonoid glycosyltransferase YjiC (YdhE family)